ncbi:MAG: putative 2OG-Fe(II) oxygenase [Pseudomonadota bacterium]
MTSQLVEEAQNLFLQGKYSAAQALLSPLLSTAPEHVDALQVLGLIAQQERDMERALAHLSRAAQLAPTRPDLLTNLGNLLRALERREEALPHLERAARLAPDHAMIHINLGLVHQDMQQLNAAETAFRTALDVQPNLAAAYQNLGHLLMLSDLPQARAHLIRALQLSPGLHAAFKDLCAVLISVGEPAPALALCTARLQKVPSDQDALAMMALALRELGRDTDADRLVDCDVWLKGYALAAPPGYNSIEEFNTELEAHILQHPKLTSVLFAQATHHGKRVNDLLEEPKGPIRLLEQMMMRQIQTYLSALPKLPEHPFFAQSIPSQSHLRSWAVLMERHGYETPHIHPDGFISGVYYVRLPAVVAKDDASYSGWIEFGTPDPVFAIRSTAPTRKVQPVAGTMLLFPSYFWHRTIPFDSAEERLSIAFDMTGDSIN